jgi:probable F420-dependent oxidoreductase
MMKLDTTLPVHDLAEVAAYAKAAEEMGFDTLWSTEAQHDPFLPLAVAATSTQRLKLGTAIAVAFPRSPTILAHTSWDLQASSQGRFTLGLGTQVKGHNERRFGVKWESPAKKLREMILALRAIWDCWQNGTPLKVSGEFYNLSLMTPAFNPGPQAHPHVPIYIAGVNPRMCRLAGELCDGFHVHPLHSVRYLQEVVLPNIEQGAAKAGRSRRDLELASMVFVITGDSPEEVAAAKERTRMRIAFYASTRNYRVVLDTHGWGEVSTRLSKKAAQGDWQGMAQEITDEMLEEYAVIGSPDEIPEKLHARYDGILDRLAFYFPYRVGEHDARWRRLVQAFHT